jgi:hypothetical protein
LTLAGHGIEPANEGSSVRFRARATSDPIVQKFILVLALAATGCSVVGTHPRPHRPPAKEPCARDAVPAIDVAFALVLAAAAGSSMLRWAGDDHACDGPCRPNAERTMIGFGIASGAMLVSGMYGFGANSVCRSALADQTPKM